MNLTGMPSAKKPSRIAFVVQLPQKVSPGQRFRFEQYEPTLAEPGFSVDTFPFFNAATHKILYQKGHLFQKITGVVLGFAKRILFLFRSVQYDYIFLQREVAPVGPPVFEWIFSKLLRKKIIFDFDDAIWIPNVSESNSIAGFAKCFWKIKYIVQWSYKVAAGNAYLAAWAGGYNKNVVLLPTCVDTSIRYNKQKDHNGSEVVIGWTGSHSTLKYLEQVYPVLARLEKEMAFTFLVICDQPPQFSLQSLQFLPWKEATEIDDLLKINIGIMPLESDAWSEGKCGFKLIQYLALGIPAVASPVGVNKQIIEPGVNGFLCLTEEEWYAALKTLLQNAQLRSAMGTAGVKKIKEQYSIEANSATFLSLFS